jgi:hypothetical protein
MLAFLCGCAEMAPPPGGPRDEIPPEVIEHTPGDGATGISLTTAITITFSEKMDRETVEEHMHLSPYPGEVKFSWKGERVTLTLSPTLSKDITYICTIGTETEDYHYVPMAYPYSFAFSTGDTLDSGIISGTVYYQGRPLAYSPVWAYMGAPEEFGEHRPDPFADLPHYATGCDSLGRFTFTNLSTDADRRYRIYSFRDANRDRKPNAGREPLGIVLPDLFFTEEEQYIREIAVFLTMGDDTPPGLVSARADGSRRVDVTFSREPLMASARVSSNYRIESLDGDETIDALRIHRDRETPRVVSLITTPHVEGHRYRLTVEDIRDLAGRSMDSLRTSSTYLGKRCDPGEQIELSCPALKQSGLKTGPLPRLTFHLSREVATIPVGNFVHLERDTLVTGIEGTTLWEGRRAFSYQPLDSLEAKPGYRIFVADTLKGWDGEYLAGETDVRFTVLPAEELGRITGSVAGWDPRSDVCTHLRVLLISSGQDTVTAFPDTSGYFSFPDTPFGIYAVQLYSDMNANQRWDAPDPYLFLESEPHHVYGEPVEIMEERREAEILLEVPWLIGSTKENAGKPHS